MALVQKILVIGGNGFVGMYVLDLTNAAAVYAVI
jgi:nucleoside-diphosphate-sugar epimerase